MPPPSVRSLSRERLRLSLERRRAEVEEMCDPVLGKDGWHGYKS